MSFKDPSPHNFRLFHKNPSMSLSTLPSSTPNFHRKVASSPTSSPYKDLIPSEIRANSPKNYPLSFNTLHSKYQTTPNQPTKTPLPTSSPRKKYLNSIHRLNQEIQIMSTQLNQAHETIKTLTNQLNEISHSHAQHIQEVHERHEQKITKLRSDIEKLLNFKGISTQTSIHKVVLEKNFELEEQQQRFRGRIAEIEREHEERMKGKEKEHSEQIRTLKRQFLDVVEELKDKFFVEIQEVQGGFRKEVEKVKEAMKVIGEGSSDSEVSTALEVDQEKNNRMVNGSDLQVIEELSFSQNMLKGFEDIPETNDFDASLCLLMNQIGFDSEVSLTDILSN